MGEFCLSCTPCVKGRRPNSQANGYSSRGSVLGALARIAYEQGGSGLRLCPRILSKTRPKSRRPETKAQRVVRMRTPPPSVIDSWPEPNYVNPETRGPRLLITQLIFVPLALLVLLARLYVRIFVVRRAGWDDCLMVMDMVRRLFPDHELRPGDTSTDMV